MSVPTASAVSRVLGKRHRRSESHSTRVRGYHRRNEGFQVEQMPKGVMVSHRMPSSPLATSEVPDWAQRMEDRIDNYAQTLMEAGYEVEAKYDGHHSRIIVTGKKES